MDKPNETLRERLLAMEKTDATRKERIEKQLQVLVEKRLSVWQRVGFGLLAGIGALLVFSFLDLVSWVLDSDPEISITVLGPWWLLGFLPALAWTAQTAYLVIRGRFGAWIRPSLVAGSGVAMMFVYMALWTFLVEVPLVQENPQDGRIVLYEQLAAVTFFMLIFVGLYLILRVVYRIEFRTREKLLEIEYHLADLAERIEGGTKSQETPGDATP